MSSSRGSPQSNPGRVIRASEIGEFGFCPRAWWLSRVEGLAGANQAELARGSETHRRHGRSLWVALAARRAALVLLAISVLIAAALVVSQIASR